MSAKLRAALRRQGPNPKNLSHVKGNLEVRFWGVRGSIPTPGEHTRRWGGNTSCIEIRHENLPPLVFDCGTGSRELGVRLLGEKHRELDLVFTHFHMDHVFGFPFFAPIYTPGYQVRVTIPAYSEEEAREKIARYLNGVYHPTRLRDLPSKVTFAAIRPGDAFPCGGFMVKGLLLNHPGGSVGYRVEVEGQSIAYMTDSAPFARPGEGVAAGEAPNKREADVIEFLKDCDVVVYDTMYELDEYLDRMTWGHSYPDYALALCRAAKAKHLVLFHHAPDARDDQMDERNAKWVAVSDADLRVSCAREGEAVKARG